VRRLLPPVLLLLVAAPAVGATIRGTVQGDLLIGTAGPDTIHARAGNDFVQAAWGGIDTVYCGSGRDVVSADLGDHVSADCEVVDRRLSADASLDPRSQHETAVEPAGSSSGSTVVVAFQLGRIKSGAASNIGWATSTDAGRTWRRGVLPSLTTYSSPPGPDLAASDPTVAYDAAHRTWLIGTLTLERTSSHVVVARSQDAHTWSAPVTVATGPALDKDWLACDNGAASPHRGRCYATYTNDGQKDTVVQWSDDGGQTWSQPVAAASTLVGTQPVVLPDGTLVVVVGDYQGETALDGAIDALVSHDGGATWTRVTISTLQSHDAGRLREASLPSAAVDAAGTIDAVWADCRFRAGCSGDDLVLSTSTDGIVWTAPVRIPLAPLTSSEVDFIPGLGADPRRPGHLGLVYAYYVPGSCERGSCRLATGFVQSTNGGATWTVPQRLDALPVRLDWLARAAGGRMVGDYYATSYAGKRVVPVFTLAAPPLPDGRFREAIFAASLPAR
jgi:hypothetical protein